MDLFHPRPQESSQSRQDKLAEWLDCPAALDFKLLLRSKIAERAAKVAQSHCDHAQQILANPSGSREDQELTAEIARYAIVMQVLDEISREAESNTKERAAAFEFLSGLDLEK